MIITLYKWAAPDEIFHANLTNCFEVVVGYGNFT